MLLGRSPGLDLCRSQGDTDKALFMEASSSSTPGPSAPAATLASSASAAPAAAPPPPSPPPPPPPPPLRVPPQGHLKPPGLSSDGAAGTSYSSLMAPVADFLPQAEPDTSSGAGNPHYAHNLADVTSDSQSGQQDAPLPLTQQDSNPLSMTTSRHDQLPSGPLSVSSHSQDPYQDYFHAGGATPASLTATSRPYSSYDQIAGIQQPHLDLRTSYGSYHDFGSGRSSGGGGGSGSNEPGNALAALHAPPDASACYFYSSSTAAASSNGASGVGGVPGGGGGGGFRYHSSYDLQQSNSCFAPGSSAAVAPPATPSVGVGGVGGFSLVTAGGASATPMYHPTQHHFQPSPAVLLHIKYVMESISECMQFTDVTIVAASNHRLRAHRSILASHSTYLRQLLIANSHDSGNAEDPTLVLHDVDSAHIRLMMQFFYTGEVSLTSQDDVAPLKEVCLTLGVASLMARLEELSLSLQCLPSYEDPFKYCQGQAGEGASGASGAGDRDAIAGGESELNHSKESLFTAAGAETFPVPASPASTGDEVSRVVEENAKEVTQSAVDEATNSFDTSFLGDEPQPSEASSAMPCEQASATGGEREMKSCQKAAAAVGSSRVKRKTHSCSNCSSKFYTAESLEAHERVHRGKKPFSCAVCGVATTTRSHLAIHMRIHSNEKPYTCPTCRKAFSDASAHRRHLLIHANKKAFQCEICKKEYSDRSTFKRHQKEKHSADEAVRKRYACKVCGKESFRRATLAIHLRRVHKQQLAKTGKTDKLDAVLNSFIVRTQKGKRGAEDGGNGSEKEKAAIAPQADKCPTGKKEWTSIKCPQCDMIFYKQSSMEIHLRSHTGDKPYVCELCGKKFARSNNLKLHKRIHTGEKPYVCNVDPDNCSKAFSDVSAFKRHIRIHTGERPYECDSCKRTFAQMSTMRAHRKNCKGASASPHSSRAPSVNCNEQPASSGSRAISVAAEGMAAMGKDSPLQNASSRMGAPPLFMSKNVVQTSRRMNASSSYPGIESTNNSSDFMMVATEDNSLSVLVGSETAGMNSDTLDSVRASCM